MKAKFILKMGIAALSCAVGGATSGAQAQSYTVPAGLQAKIDSHPHVRKVTDWGSRADWSADSKRLLYVSREYGDAFELDIATGRTRPITFHFSHDGFLRAYYLANGDILLNGVRDHVPGMDIYGRFNQSELWVLKGDLSGPPVPLNERNMEGLAVARNSMKIAWAKPAGPADAKATDEELRKNPQGIVGRPNQIWIGDIVMNGGPATLANRRMLLDCGDSGSQLAKALASEGKRCMMIEPQNFVPKSEDRMTFSVLTSTLGKVVPIEISSYQIDLKTHALSKINKAPGYAEVEGVFPDGKWTVVEHSPQTEMGKANHVIDLWRVALDSSGKQERLTHYNALDPQLKSNQGAVSPDGRWMVFGVSTSEIEAKVAGQGIGLFLLDLRAAGF